MRARLKMHIASDSAGNDPKSGDLRVLEYGAPANTNECDDDQMSDHDRRQVAGRLLEFTRRERILLVAARGAAGAQVFGCLAKLKSSLAGLKTVPPA